ncbi:hybrid sensor histidine kinase/response regulator [Desulfatirhabdium butyrativorans]|uniref:hybrid sensor histidine kinase/response regulator n=1 Tax=Desulfatirhabdium butyrativorans TaxID=340467 RepID=UPI00041132B9|nr:hybrid sensor histidine kinase/response regulator [Desulfatirhabdium butyrativorans]
MSLTQDELLKAFVDEALDHLSTIEDDFLAIEKAGADIDPERINKVFRGAHSIKGGAGFIGLSKIRDLAHAIETVLGKLRTKTLKPDREIVSVLLSATDLLRRMVLNVTDHDAIDVSEPIAALNHILGGTPSTDASSRENLPENENTAPATTNMECGIAPDLPEGSHVYRFAVCPEKDPSLKDRSFEDFLHEISAYGTILSKRPCGGTSNQNIPGDSTTCPTASFEVSFACILDKQDLALLLDIEADRITELPSAVEEIGEETMGKTSPSDDPEDDSAVQEALSEPPGSSRPTRIEADRTPHPPTSMPDPAEEALKTAQPVDPPRSRDQSVPPIAYMPIQAAEHQSIRVHLDVLDSLVNLAGELVLSRNQLLKTVSQTESSRLQSLAKRVDLITSDLQHVIMKTRMRPIGDLFHRFPRVIRDIALHLGKEVELTLDGADVELDRTVIEAINDPLVHMLRNAVDHGIEPPAQRLSIGKPATGHIHLSAFSQGGQVIIDVRDDGAGIDPENIARSAIAKGFVAEEKVRLLSPEDKIRLIFSPGFSTSQTVTEWSGRGVGMDVVKANIEKLGGTIDIDSRHQAGTRFRIKLPLTLAIIACQLVHVEGQRFAIPQVHIEELIRIKADRVKDRIEIVGNAEVLRLRGRLLPLIRLTDVLKIQRTFVDPDTKDRMADRRKSIADRRSRRFGTLFSGGSADDDTCMPAWTEGGPETESPGNSRRCSDRRYHSTSAINVLVINSGTVDYGLIVDSFHDFEEIVVKPLGKHFRNCRVFSGATILGDGSIALILDVNQIPILGKVHSVSGTSRALEIARPLTPAANASSRDMLHLVVFRNAPGDHLAVPISSVVRIIRCRNRDIRHIGDIATINHIGQDLRIIEAEEGPAIGSRNPDETNIVIIFRVGGRILGLLGKGPVDTMLTSEPIDGVLYRSEGVIGSIRVGEVTIRLLDLVDLVHARHPEWIGNPEHARKGDDQNKTVLLVEDSDFFRSHVASILQSAGYRILTAADGQQGWESLQEHGDEISVVVTDIEMPRMNGYELVRTIRRDRRWANLPIAALTTLADDADRQKAFDAGVTDYQIKLDKESLLQSLQTLLQPGK